MTKQDIVKNLMSKGFSRREAAKALQSTLDVIKQSLKDHDSVETPIGTFEVREAPQQQRYWRLNRIVVQYGKRYRIRFIPQESNGK